MSPARNATQPPTALISRRQFFQAGGVGALAMAVPGTVAAKPKKPALYDPKADARTQIDAATAKAKRQNARVLVMFGFEG